MWRRWSMRAAILALATAGALTGCQTWTVDLPTPQDPEWVYVRALCEEVTEGRHSFRNGRCRICQAVKPAPPPVAEPEPQPPAVTNAPPQDPLPIGTGEPNPARPQDYAAGFLWKPVAESDGKLVVLIPSKFTGHISEVWMELQGTRVETGKGVGLFNGNRWHVRFSKVGAAYTDGVSIVCKTDSRRRWYWTIPDTARRWDGQITPKAVGP